MSIPNFITVENISLFVSEDDIDFYDEVDWENQSYATFSICETSFTDYEITEDKTLYKKDEDGLLLLDEYTGQIDFGTVLVLEDKDYEIELRAIFYKGEMRDSSLIKIKKLDREIREQATDKLMQEVERHEARQKAWWFKLYMLYTKCVTGVFTVIRFVLAFFIKVCWYIQNKIT
tara:strand:+ start:5598 stop:6122 length:525 start_codon:yes stop_codon:yes gene_type:complete